MQKVEAVTLRLAHSCTSQQPRSQMELHGLAALSSRKELPVPIGETVGSRTSVDAEKRIISWPATNRAPNPGCSARSLSHLPTGVWVPLQYPSRSDFGNGGIRPTTHPTHIYIHIFIYTLHVYVGVRAHAVNPTTLY